MAKRRSTFKTLFIKIFPLITFFSNCSYNKELNNDQVVSISKKSENENTTIFIHGTLFGLSWLVRLFECPLGLTPATSLTNRYVLGQIPHILNKESDKFPFNKFYFWGWHGELSFRARSSSSHKFYHKAKHISGQKTVIAQSHGGNLALNSAKIAQRHNDKNFSIDRLILLATPVQEVNSHLVSSPVFKKVNSLYSSDDLIQVLDPQGLYQVTKRLKNNTKLFSERVFKPAPNLVQAEITMDEGPVSHMDFLHEKFLKHLPYIIDLLDDATKNKTDYENFHYKINIPIMGKPHFVEKK